MSATVMLHAEREEMRPDVERRTTYTALGLRCGDMSLTVFLTESQLDELATVLNDAIAERVDCEDCDDGYVFVGVIEASLTTPTETLTDPCETCDGRGWVLPEKDDE